MFGLVTDSPLRLPLDTLGSGVLSCILYFANCFCPSAK